ncbi:MAG: hypothetical protein MUF21_07260 [Gemmatimonadaceae bacterium]|jgi:hypothetical protein|nr:hypothetical protein [Gemmatimonadaceae bacterium]
MTRTPSLLLAGLALAAAPLAAQVTDAGERIHFLRVVAKDYVFEAKPTSPAGITTIQLVNQGGDIHHLLIVELPTNRTPKEFYETNRATGAMPAWAKVVAQTPTIPANGEVFLTQRLEAGRYILSCQLAASDGRSHVAKGMYQLITVTPSAAAPRVAGTRKP